MCVNLPAWLLAAEVSLAASAGKMQRLKSHTLEGEIARRLETERRESKHAETRLRNGLHDLEEARFYCINRMTKEQRRVQRDLTMIKNGYSKKKVVSSFGRLCPDTNTAVKESPDFSNKVSLIKPPAKDGSFILASERIRAQNHSPVRAARIVIPPSVSHALQTQINEFLSGFGGEREKPDKHAAAEEVQALTPPKLNAEVRTDGATASTSNQPVTKPAISVTDGAGGNQAAQESSPDGSEFYAPDGLPRTMHTMPSFLEAFAEARKARYIRHRNKPDSEKELPISEIFRKCNGPIQRVTEKEATTVRDNSSMGANSN
ncbi:coiled-coil domain-containing protein 190 isoform X1 [Hemitrygon akajei]|uniref:coiled-coil domain-containing protein 190 isoform X1 n=2 Tax=Hemitrygon akajei TaxID=2704970 RepID=UPI003BF97F32